MKKLKLSLQNMEGAEFLTREQLKKVMGGSGSGSGGGSGSGSGGFCACDSSCSRTVTVDGHSETFEGTCQPVQTPTGPDSNCMCSV